MQGVYGFGRCASWGGVVLVGLLAVAGLLGWVLPGGNQTTQLAILIGLAVTVATVTGFLLASAVFALQFHGQRLGRLAFLLEYLTRREGLVPIATLNLTIVAASALAAIGGALGWAILAPGMLALNVVLVPISTLAGLWVLYRLLTSVAGDVLADYIVPLLNRDLDEASTSEDIPVELSKRLGGPMLASASPPQDEPIYDLLGIEAGCGDPVLLGVVDVFKRASSAHRRDRLRRLLSARVSQRRLGEIGRAVAGRFDDWGCLASLIVASSDAGVPGGTAAVRTVAGGTSYGSDEAGERVEIACGCYADKVALIEASGEADEARSEALTDDLVERLGHELADKLDPELARLAVERAPSVCRLDDLGELEDALLRAMGELASRGHRPAVIMVPERSDVAGSTAPIDVEAAGDGRRFGEDHLGRWRQCEVFRWPAGVEASCVVVLDPAAFYVPIRPPAASGLSLDWEDPDKETHDAWLRACRAGEELADSAGKIELIVRARLRLRIGVRDSSASARIDLPASPRSGHQIG